jgi:hypothetical protein
VNISGIIDAIPNMDRQQRQTIRERPRTWLAHGSGDRASAARLMLAALDAFEAREREGLVGHVAPNERVQRIYDAFQRLPMSETEGHVVHVLLDNPGLTSERLTAVAGWKGQTWHLLFGSMCRHREHLLWSAPFDEGLGRKFYSATLADFDPNTRGFTLKPEAVEAFNLLGLRPRGGRERP